jgi:hypothetical protein
VRLAIGIFAVLIATISLFEEARLDECATASTS